MSQLLDNVINGNRSDARSMLKCMTRAEAMRAIIDLIEDLADHNGASDSMLDDVLNDVRSLVEPM